MIAFIGEHKDSTAGGLRWGVEPMCTVLTEHGIEISASTYYEWAPTARQVRDEEVVAVMVKGRTTKALVAALGSRKMWLYLRAKGHDVARCTIERLYREQGWEGARYGKKTRTTIPNPGHERAPDLVHRRFFAPVPNRLWVADFTQVATWSGKVYIAFVIDAYSRRIVGWRVAPTMSTALVLDALEHALHTRAAAGVADVTGLISHSDAGSQGGFNWSSQHPVMEVLSGSSSTGSRSGDPPEVAVPGASEVPASCRGGVLGRDRQGPAAHRGCGCGRRGARGWSAVVPSRWRHAALRRDVQALRAVPIVR